MKTRAYVFVYVLLLCRDPVLRRDILDLELDNFTLKLRILKLKLANVLSDYRIRRFDRRFEKHYGYSFNSPNVSYPTFVGIKVLSDMFDNLGIMC